MRAFIELRDALACLESACVTQNGSNWLHAACDLRASLLGDLGRKGAVSELIALFGELKGYLKNLCDDTPQYRERILRSCDQVDRVIEQLQPGIPEACDYLASDALVNAYLNAQKKHDWLGHKLCMQQSINAIWSHSDARTLPLHQALTPLCRAVDMLDQMLNDFVSWKKCVAKNGCGQITPERGKSYGLLVIAMSADAVANGIIPDISGNRLAIRLRFQHWAAGKPPSDYEQDLPYAKMLIPIGCG